MLGGQCRSELATERLREDVLKDSVTEHDPSCAVGPLESITSAPEELRPSILSENPAEIAYMPDDGKSYTDSRSNREIEKILSENDEIQILRRRLHAVKLNQERSLQIAEKLSREKISQENERQLERLQFQRAESATTTSIADAPASRQTELRKVLDLQVAEKQQAIQKAVNEIARERQESEFQRQMLRNDEETKLRAKREKEASLRAELRDLMVARKERCSREVERERLDERRMAEYQQSVYNRQLNAQAEHDTKKSREEQTRHALSHDLQSVNIARDEMNRLREELYQNEVWQRQDREAAASAQRQADMKREILSQYEDQMRHKADLSAQRQVENAKMHTILQDQFEKDITHDRIALTNRRDQMKSFYRDSNSLRSAKHNLFVHTHDKEREHQNQLSEDKTRIQKLVEAEKARLLGELSDMSEHEK